ncbi:MAG: zinc-ribbon domain-containing protein [bacterium]|nr:zinc-ribbon domain-containing protein [bacterium]
MRIQCKKCGKEYRVEESRLTTEGVRVKCRDCGAILLVRKREINFNLDSERRAVVGDLAGESVPQPEESAPASPYKYCLSCGKGLDRAIPSGERPVCRTCELLGAQGRRSLVDEVLGVPPTVSSGSRKWLYGFILALLIIAAVMGYRFASAHNTEHGAAPDVAENQVGPPVSPRE